MPHYAIFVTKVVVAFGINYSFLASLIHIREISLISYYDKTFLIFDYFITKEKNLLTKISDHIMYDM